MVKLNSEDRKKIIILVIIIAILLAILIVIVVAINSNTNKQKEMLSKKKYTSISDFETVYDVTQYLECEYKKQNISTQENYKYDLYMKLKVAPYTDGISNEKYYEKLVSLLAKVLDYSNYRIIDNDKNLIVDVICDSNENKVKAIYINGESSYFSVNDSINKLNNKMDENITNVNIQSQVIKELEKNDWETSKVELGKTDGTFGGYNIYFDEGYEVRNVNKKIFNIVFTEKYKENILNDIKTSSNREEIIEKLGEPTFENVVSEFIGYKSNDIYVFFNTKDKEISVYKRDKKEVKFSDLEDIFKTYKTNNDTVKLIYDVRTKWQDYDSFSSDKNNLYISYIAKGIKLEYDKNNKIFNVYNNSNIDLTSDNLKDYKFINMVDKDLYYLTEIERKSIKSQALYTANDEKNEENRKLKTTEFCLYRKEMNDKSYEAKIISLSSKYMSSELRENINSFIWGSNTILIYSVSGKGIYAYNAVTRKYTTLKSGNAKFELKEYKDGILYYDDTSISFK